MEERKSLRHLESRAMLLETQLNVKEEHSKTLDKYIERAAQETQTMIYDMRKFCFQMLESEIASGNIKTSELAPLSVMQLLERVEAFCDEKKKRSRKINEKFIQMMEEKNIAIATNQTLISQLRVKLSSGFSEIEEEKIAEETGRTTAYLLDTNAKLEDIKPVLEMTEILENDESVIDFVKNVSNETNTAMITKKAGSKNGIINTDILRQKMTTEMWRILEAIGNEGISEQTDVINYCKKYNPNCEATIYNTLTALSKKRIISRTKIGTGIRWFLTIEFTGIGRDLFVEQYKKEPVETEVQKLIKKHDNVQHGYMIKDAAKILREIYHYKVVCIDRKRNHIPLSDGKSCIPDIVAVKSQSTDYFELECGNHIQAEFNDKCNKLKMITKRINFIVPEAGVMMKKTMPQIEKWIKDSGGIKLLAQAGITVYVTTMTKFADKKWAVIYNMTENNPIILKK